MLTLQKRLMSLLHQTGNLLQHPQRSNTTGSTSDGIPPPPPTVWSRLLQRSPMHLYSVVNKDLEDGDGEMSTAYSFLSVTLHPHMSFLQYVAAALSFSPFVMALVFALWFIFAGHVFPFLCLMQLLVASFITEALLKRLVRQPRPALSAVPSYGMPSSHCVSAYCLLMWMVLELSAGAHYGWSAKMTHGIAAVVSLLPIPWARWYLHDHTRFQCSVGCACGTVMGIIAFGLRFLLVPRGVPLF